MSDREKASAKQAMDSLSSEREANKATYVVDCRAEFLDIVGGKAPLGDFPPMVIS